MKNYNLKKHFLAIFSLLALLVTHNLARGQCTILGDSVLCENESVTYTTAMTGAVYQWNAYPGVAIPTGSGASATVNWGGTGTGLLTLVVKDAYGKVLCSTSKHVDIFSAPTPIIIPSFIAGCNNNPNTKGQDRKGEECMSVCDSTWVTYSVLDHVGSTYNWSVAGSAIVVPSTSNTFQVMWTGTGAGVVKVTETSIHGCTGKTELCVKIVPRPNAIIDALPAPVAGLITACLGQEIIFHNNSNTGGGSPLWSYTWVWGDGSQTILDNGSNGNTTHEYTSPGAYTVMFIAENDCHCKDTTYIKVLINSSPAPDIECISTVCPGTAVTYTTNASCTGYAWTATNGGIIGSAIANSVTVNWTGAGPGYLGLTTTGCSPATCPIENIVEIPVIVPSATITGPSLICQYNCEKFKISCTIPIDSIVWHFPGGVYVTTDTINLHQVEACFNNPLFDTGTIFVEYFHTAPGSVNNLSCGGTASLFVSAKPRLSLYVPEICDNSTFSCSFNTALSGTLKLNIKDGLGVDTSFTISATSSYSTNWIWGPGTFTITLTDLSGNYCNSPQSTTLIVNENPASPIDIVGQDIVCPNTAYLYSGIGTSSEYALSWSGNNGTSPISGVGPSYSMITDVTGPYEICLQQIDPQTLCVSDKICDTLSPAFPIAAPVISGPDTVCNNGNQPYVASTPANEVEWTIVPAIAGSVINGQGGKNVTIQWNNWVGNATIYAIATGCGSDTALGIYKVNVIGTPAPALTLQSTACEGESVPMSSTTPSATFAWDFGDGTTGSGNPANHTYNTSGNMLVTLTATYTGYCTGTASTTKSIMIYPKPNVSISTPDPNVFCGPIGTVNMHVASPAIGTTYQWVYNSPYTNLGTGTLNSSNTKGVYYVIATNTYGCIDSSNLIRIDSNCVKGCKPKQGSFVKLGFQRLGCNTDTFFSAMSAGAINPQFTFDDPFGSPNYFNGTTTSHTFPEPGYYRVKFCADVPEANGNGYCRMCDEKIDTVKYIADFMDSMYCSNGVDSLRMKMINTTKILSGMPTPSYAWSINAGPTISTAANPTFTLPPGTYTINLKVNGVCIKSKVITVDAFPVASFTAQDSICENSPLFITNTSTGMDTTTALWLFGDGASSKVVYPTKVYPTAGLYILNLTIGNAYGCTDNFMKKVIVLPNTLNALYKATPPTLCEGDSLQLFDISTGGYPSYNWLWSTIDTTPNISVKYTGTYYFDLVDSKGCRARSNEESFLFNPTPKPLISGEKNMCLGMTSTKLSVNYPSSGFSFVWSKDGVVQAGYTNNYYYIGGVAGSYVMDVMVKSDSGCVGYDTFVVNLIDAPNVAISSAGVLCEGDENLLVGNSTTTNIVGQYWQTGATSDSLYAVIPGNYTFTVVDSLGCKNSASKIVNPLPDFCGVMTGCYEFCDTISQLVWYAPKGYSTYQWLYNGLPISGANSDTLHVPLYQSGTYNIELKSYYGCIDTSENIDIEFTKCGKCVVEMKYEVDCGPVNSAGQQTYTITLHVNNTLSPGAMLNLYSSEGVFSGTTPTVLPLGWSTVTTTFTDVSVTGSDICITAYLSSPTERCKGEICFELPNCDGKCEIGIKNEKIDCVGYDDLGNPMYLLCTDVYWSGSNGSTLTITTPSGSFSPNPVTVNNGLNPICFTYTDLPPHTGYGVFTLNIFDPIKGKVCKDSFKMQYKPCPENCNFGIYGICAHCKDRTKEGWLYNIELTVDNTLGAGATVSALPISAGYFGTISPNPIGYGIQTINVPFTDVPARDSVICFRVIIELKGKKCWQDVCVFLPDCETIGINEIAPTYFSVAPNPAKETINVKHNFSGNSQNTISIYDMVGKKVKEIGLANKQLGADIDVSNLANGVYIINFRSDGKSRGNIKMVVQH